MGSGITCSSLHGEGKKALEEGKKALEAPVSCRASRGCGNQRLLLSTLQLHLLCNFI